jgi:hypothetical protein
MVVKLLRITIEYLLYPLLPNIRGQGLEPSHEVVSHEELHWGRLYLILLKVDLGVNVRLWQAVTGCDRLWQAVTGCDRLWQAVTGCDRLWQAVTGCDKIQYCNNYHCRQRNYRYMVSVWHFFSLSLCHFVTLSLCRFVALSLCRFVALSLCRFVTLSLCHFVTLSLCHINFYLLGKFGANFVISTETRDLIHKWLGPIS